MVGSPRVHGRFANGTDYSPMTVREQIRPFGPLTLQRLLLPLLHLALPLSLAGLGAFGTYVAMGFPGRLLHFSITSLAVSALIVVLAAALRRYVFAGTLPLWAMAAVALATAPAGGLIVQQSLAVFAPHALAYVSLAELTGQVMVINLVGGAVVWMLRRRLDAPAAAAAAVTAVVREDVVDPGSELRAKLPSALRHAPILALSAEDHYVRVRTARGQALILMNLSDAIAALGPDSGVRIHRSHWVCRDIAEAARDNSRNGVAVADDAVLPVSRTGRKLLSEQCPGRERRGAAEDCPG